jgi:hypothetical protein
MLIVVSEGKRSVAHGQLFVIEKISVGYNSCKHFEPFLIPP